MQTLSHTHKHTNVCFRVDLVSPVVAYFSFRVTTCNKGLYVSQHALWRIILNSNTSAHLENDSKSIYVLCILVRVYICIYTVYTLVRCEMRIWNSFHKCRRQNFFYSCPDIVLNGLCLFYVCFSSIHRHFAESIRETAFSPFVCLSKSSTAHYAIRKAYKFGIYR